MDRVGGMPETELKSICHLGLHLMIFFLIGWFLSSNLFRAGAQSLLSEEKIPEKGAICQLDQQEFIVKGKNKALLRVHRVFRIYNQRGKEYGRVGLKLNKFIKVDKIKAHLRDTDGRLIRKLKKDEIKEESICPGYALYADDRLKYFDLSTTTFPYVLEYSYQVEYKSLFFWPDWSPQREIPVESSVYKLTVPEDVSFKIRKRDLEIEPIEKQSKGKRQLIFQLAEIPPFKAEKNMSPEMDHRMCVLFAPQEFDLAGYKGSTNSWQDFGKWYASLAHEQYELSAQPRGVIADLVKNCPSAEEKVKALYQFLQRKTRYVSVDLGIGGWKPRRAESVLATGYGDCKDLATLFIAMLNVTGIQAYPVLIRTRSAGTVLADFPSHQFNHVITCVPLEQDTLWLDCTCNYCPFGELPWIDEGCHALVIMKKNATLIETPTSSAEQNRITRSIKAKLEPDGSLEITGTLAATGNCESSYRQLLNSLPAVERKEWLASRISRYAPNYTLLSYDFEKIPDLDVPLGIGFTAKLIDYPTRAGNDFLINLNLLSRVAAKDILKEKKREYPVDNQFAFTQEDEITLDFPEDFGIKAVPSERDMVLPFGSFQTQYTAGTHQIRYKRIQTVTQRLIQPADFEEYKSFVDTMYTADHSFVVLKRSE